MNLRGHSLPPPHRGWRRDWADHSTNPPETTPILVMDMYEHAYQMDYGAAAAKYIDAFFANIRWDAVAKRIAAASAASAPFSR